MTLPLVRVHHCVRCDHDWVRRRLKDATTPTRCPACGDPGWQKARTHPQRRRGDLPKRADQA